jgi:hypothetical protein
VLQIALNSNDQDRSDNRFFYDYARMKLEPLPHGAILLTSGDTVDHTIQYLQVCELMREDVTAAGLSLLNQYWAGPVVRRHLDKIVIPGDVFMPSQRPERGSYMVSVQGKDVGYRDAYSLSYLFDANIEDHPIYTSKFQRHQDFRDAMSWSAGYYLLPMGTLNKVLRKGEGVDFDAYLSECVQYLPDLDAIGTRPPDKDTWEYLIWSEYWNNYQTQFYTFVRLLEQTGASDRSIDRLLTLMDKFAIYCPFDLQDAFYWDMALVYALAAERDERSRTKLIDLWESRLKTSTPPSERHATTIRQAFQR